jgi:UDP-N-acetylmuramoylalanine--D-glutamate ligase
MFKLSKNKNKNIEELRSKKVAVLGAARSGIAVSLLLATSGASVLLSDIKNHISLPLPFENINKYDIEVETGKHSNKILECDLICISPGIPLTIPILQQAVAKKIPIVAEIEIAYWFCQGPIIAITGSNGKTTTTTLTGEVLRSIQPEVVVAGNIGKPFAEYVQHVGAGEWVVLEISSFQVETIYSFHPQITVVLNLTPNHLDRYPDFESYAAAKLNILKNLTERDTVIFNSDDEYLSNKLKHVRSDKLIFSLKPHNSKGAWWQGEFIMTRINQKVNQMVLKNHTLRGPHNKYNILVAALIGQLMGVSGENVRTAIENFPGIEHRLEEVGYINSVLFVNDSKATTVASLSYALQSFEKKIVLISGGKDKGGDFSEVIDWIKRKVKAVVVLGESAEKIESVWKAVVPVYRAGDLARAVEIAYQQASPGEVVLLSPACSSFDMFEDYEDRGNQFKNIVKGLS